MDGGGRLHLSVPRDDFAKAVGVRDFDFAREFVRQIVKASGFNERVANFILTAVVERQPKDITEAMAFALMARAYMTGMQCSMHMANAQTLDEVAIYGSGFNSSSRNFGKLMDAVERKRSGHQQTSPAVQNIAVTDGGQAIVGNVTHNARIAPERSQEITTEHDKPAEPPKEKKRVNANSKIERRK